MPEPLTDAELALLAREGTEDDLDALSDEELQRLARVFNRSPLSGVGEVSVRASERKAALESQPSEQPGNVATDALAGVGREYGKAATGLPDFLPQQVLSGRLTEGWIGDALKSSSGPIPIPTQRPTDELRPLTQPPVTSWQDEKFAREGAMKFDEAARKIDRAAAMALGFVAPGGGGDQIITDVLKSIGSGIVDFLSKPGTTMEEKPEVAVNAVLDMTGVAALGRGVARRVASAAARLGAAETAQKQGLKAFAERELGRDVAAEMQGVMEDAAQRFGVERDIATKQAAKRADTAARADVYPFNLLPGAAVDTVELGSRVQAGREASELARSKEMFPFLPSSITGETKAAATATTAVTAKKASKTIERTVTRAASRSPKVAAAIAPAVEQVSDDLVRAAGIAAKAGATKEADIAADVAARLSSLREKVARQIAPETAKQLNEVKAATKAAKKLSPEAGQVTREELVKMGLSLAGGATAGVLGREEGEAFDLKDAVFGAVGGFGLAKYMVDQRFRTAINRFTSIDKSDPKEIGNLEEVFRSIIEPILPDREISIGALQMGGTAGAATVGALGGAVVGGAAGEDGFSPVGALLGGVMGAGIGGVYGKNLAGALSGGINPRKSYIRMFTETGGVTPEVAEQFAKGRTRLAGRIVEIADQQKTLSKLDQETVNNIDLYLKGAKDVSDLPENVRGLASSIRHTWDELALDIVEFELATGPTAQKILSNIGTYQPRLYLQLEREDALLRVEKFLRGRGESLSKLSDKDYLKKLNENIPTDIREAWGEVSAEFNAADPGYLLGKRAGVMAADVETHRIFNWMRSSEYVADIPTAEMGGILRTEAGRELLEIEGKRFLKMPSNKRYGVLRDKFVEENVAYQLQDMVELPSQLRRLIDAGTGAFKAFKITYNPATLARNVYSDFILTDVIAGIGPHRVDKYIRGFRDYATETELYKEARRAGLFGSSSYQTEIREMVAAIEKGQRGGTGPVGALLDWAANNNVLGMMPKFHEASEHAFKQVVYSHARKSLGMSVDDAVRLAQKSLFNYREIPRWVKLTRSSPFGAPFITFSYKALPRMLESAVAVGDPAKMLRFWKYPFAAAAVNEYSARQFGKVEEGEKGFLPTLKRLAVGTMTAGLADPYDIKKYAPDYLGDQQVLMPWEDSFGRKQMFDATFWLPWGDIGEIGKGPIGKTLAQAGIPFPRQLEPSNPWLQTGMTAISGGKDYFTGKDIWTRNAPPLETSMNFLQYLSRTWGPPLTPGAGFAAEKLRNSFTGDYESDPNVPSPVDAIKATMLGIQKRPVVERQAYEIKAKQAKSRVAEMDRELKWMIENGAPKWKIENRKKVRKKFVDEFMEKFPKEETEKLPPIPPQLLEAIRSKRNEKREARR